MNSLKKVQDNIPLILFFTTLFIVFHQDSSGQFNEDFSDNNLHTNPKWSGDIDKFIIEDGKLRSNSLIPSDEFFISTASNSVLETEWQISLDLDFKTSSANYIDLFLASDSANPSKANHAYFIRIGNTKDDISMYQILDGVTSQLTNGTDNKTENKKIDIKVVHQANGKWEIFVDYNDGNNPAIEGVITNLEISKSDYFIIRIKQSTSSFFRKHQINKIKVGPILIDSTPPKIESLIIQDPKTIILKTNEPTSISPTLFDINNDVGPPKSVEITASQIQLNYEDSLENGNYTLHIQNLDDLDGNRADTVISFTVNLAKEPKNGEIIINEIFPDPSPSVGLPEAEFIELLNLKNYPLNLENCIISDKNSAVILPKIIVPKKGFIVLCNEPDLLLFESISGVYGIKSLPSLNNNEDIITLKNKNSELLDSLNYTKSFYRNEEKQEGGYSLERIHFFSNCIESSNWIASEHSNGGTPGEMNSVHGHEYDSTPPHVLSATSNNLKTIYLQLNELPTNLIAYEPSNYELINSSNQPTSVSMDANHKTIAIQFENQLPLSSIFQLKIKELVDCSGNQAQESYIDIIPVHSAKKGDIIINEILFNPYPNGVDFIELYNTSNHYINLHELTFKTYLPNSSTYFIESNKDGIISQNEFIALSIDSSQVKYDYPEAQTILQLSKMPPMNNTEGILSLYQSDILLDSVHYHEDQHFNLLSDYNGVSLERISYDDKGSSSNNWHSASSTVGYATPGYQNSQYTNVSLSLNPFELNSSKISPDGDGYEDFLILNYQIDILGYVLNGYIYTLSGFQVHHPFNNLLISREGNLKWNGTDSNGIKLPVGNYILLIEAFNETGEIIKKKIAFGITGIF